MEAVFELVENGVKRDRRGRRITNIDERIRLIESYLASGLTQIDFSKREGMNKNTLVYWLKQYRDRKNKKERRSNFVEVGAIRSQSASLEVVLVDGTCIRGNSASEIAAMIKALR